MAKNIEMNHLSADGSYEALYPKTMANITYPSSNILSLLGLSENSNVDDAFNVLSRFHRGLGNEYLWYRYKTTYEDRFTWKSYPNLGVGATTVVKTYYCSSKVIINDNKAVMQNPTTITISSLSDCYNLIGKYCSEVSPPLTFYGHLVYISSNASFTKDGVNFRCTSGGSVCTSWFKEEVNVGEYVNSQYSNTYPPTTSDGYNYMALGQLGSIIQIATGSYTGTGTYSLSNKNSLTFDFVPKLVFVSASDSARLEGFWAIKGSLYASPAIAQSNIGGYFVENLTWDGKSLYWYTSGNSARYQFNESGVTYYWIVFG